MPVRRKADKLLVVRIRKYPLPQEYEGKTPSCGIRAGFTQEMTSKLTIEGQERIIQSPSVSL